jgi:hypothetical protein
LNEEFIDEEFQHGDVHEDVEDPSQGFMDWDSLPTYDSNISNEDLVRGSLSYDHKEESVINWDIYPKEEKSLEKVNLLDNIENFVDESSIHHVPDESPKSEVFDLDVNEVDFLGVENILSNSLEVKVFDDFYMENNFISKRKETIDSFWEIFMVHERENMHDCCVKPKFFESGVKSFQVDNCSLMVISEALFIVGCYLFLLLKRKGWKGLIGLPKDRVKNHLNSRTNSLQLGENDASQFYPFWLNSHLMSFTKKVISGVSNIGFKKTWWR